MTRKAAPQRHEEADSWPFVVRTGFVLTLGRRIYRAGEIVDLTEAQARAYRHMIEPAAEGAA